MADRPDDRLKSSEKWSDEKPEIFIIVKGEKFPRPGLETHFAQTLDKECPKLQIGCSCQPVTGVYCSCNKVKPSSSAPVGNCQTVKIKPSCSCVGHKSCSCVNHRSSSGGSYGCRCAPVH